MGTRGPEDRSLKYAWVLAFVLLFTSIGVWPLVAVEGDDAAIAVGASQLYSSGGLELTYRYQAQAGTYHLVGAVSALLSLDPLQVFCALAAVAALVFILCTGKLVGRLLEVPWVVGTLAAFVLPEMVVSGFYGNSSVLAAAFASGGLVVLAGRCSGWSVVLAAGLFAVAVWMRFDALLVVPVAAILLMAGQRDFVRRLLLFAAAFSVFVGVLTALSGVSVVEVLKSYGDHAGSAGTDLRQGFSVLGTTLPIASFVLAALGIWRWVGRRSYGLLLMTAAGVLPLVLAYSGSLTTPKYLLYGLPWVSLAIVEGGRVVFNAGSSWPRRAVIGLFVLQFILDPFWVLPGRSRVQTDDGPRYLGVVVATPLRWRQLKIEMEREQAKLQTALFSPTENRRWDFVLSDRWKHSRIVLLMFSREGYDISALRPVPGFRLFEMHKDSVHTSFLTHRDPLWRTNGDQLKNERLGIPEDRAILFVGAPRTLKLLKGASKAAKVSSAPLSAWSIYPDQGRTSINK